MADDASAWKALASRRGPLDRKAAREAAKISNMLDLPEVKQAVLRIEIKLALIRAVKYGQRHPSAK